MRRNPILLAALVLLASCGETPPDSIRVVTFNMYVGLDFEAKVAEFQEGADPEALAAEILAEFQNSDPAGRIEMAAAELAALAPDFIALQEAVLFEAAPLFRFDFVTLLTDAIEAAGGPEYQALSVENVSLEDVVETGTLLPLTVRFEDREAILYRKGFSPEGETVRIHLSAHRDPVEYDGEPLIFHRSLLGARFAAAGERPITLFTTHLDQADLGEVQPEQASEILEVLREYRSDENLVLVGDFNSREGEVTYESIAAAGYTDTFRSLNPSDPGLTCCNLPDLSNAEPVATGRIDLIFHRSSAWEAETSGRILDTRGDLWPSDHFGVQTLFRRRND